MRTIFSLLLFILNFASVIGQNINTVAGNGLAGYFGDGSLAMSAQIKNPADVAIDGFGNFYVADFSNCRVRKISSTGIITTLAGNGVCGYSGDGGISGAAQINGATGVAVDAIGNVYIADAYGHRVRKVNTSGIISTIAGNGINGYGGDGGLAINATLSYPWSIKVDGAGNIFIADNGNERIRKIDASGTITTIAGTGVPGFGGDGLAATSAQLNSPQGVAVDLFGNVYISDKLNNRIRKINTAGIITTIGGSGIQGYYGEGIPATSANLYNPIGIATDGSGNVYFADYLNNRIRMIKTSGIINTVVGSGVPGYFGDGGSATIAQIYQPWGVGVDFSGNIWVADTYNNRVRSVNSVLAINQINTKESLSFYPNPTTDKINFKLNSPSKIVVIGVLGEVVYTKNGNKGENEIDFSDLPRGIYFLKAISIETMEIQTGKIIKQ